MKIKSKKAEIKRSLSLYALMTPSLILLILFSYLPMYGIIIAFKDYNAVQGIWGSPWTKNFGFSHFIRFVTAYNFTSLIKNTLVLSLYSLVVNAICPVVLALFVNEIQNKAFKRTVQTISYSPYFISCVVMVGMVVSFLNVDRGIVNKVITSFGGKGTMFMSDPDWFVHLYVWTGVWQGVGWSSIIFTAALAGVDKSLLEAADIDGATRIQKIWYVNVPVLIPTIVIMLILQCGSLLSVGYEKVYLLQNDFNMTASEVISTYTYKVGLEQADFAFSTAVGVLNSVVNSIILIIVNAISRRVSETALW